MQRDSQVCRGLRVMAVLLMVARKMTCHCGEYEGDSESCRSHLTIAVDDVE